MVTFDAATTQLWLLSSVLSVFTTWTLDPFKMVLVTTAASHVKFAIHEVRETKLERQNSVRRIGFLVRASTKTALGDDEASTGLATEDLESESFTEPSAQAEKYKLTTEDLRVESFKELSEQAWGSLGAPTSAVTRLPPLPQKADRDERLAAGALGWDENTPES